MVDISDEQDNVSVNTVVQEKKTLREWREIVSLRTPNFLLHYSDIVAYLESFPPSKLDVSPKGDVLALMSHNRELEIYDLLEESVAVSSRVKVLEERYPEWCLLKFTASGSLLLSTRSNAIIDVFDSSGGYCYSIAVSKSVESFDASSIICDMASVSSCNETTKYLDTLYTLQYNSVFSCYKLGLLVGYISLFKVDLGQGLTTSFLLIPSIDLVVIAGQHRGLMDVKEIDCNLAGLNVYRIVGEEPFIVDVRVSKTRISLCEILTGWLFFKRSQSGVIISMAANQSYSFISVVSSVGDVFIFGLPSFRLVKHISYYNGLPKPVQTIWISQEEVAFLTRCGHLLRGKVAELEELLLGRSDEVEVFEGSSVILALKDAVIFGLESKVLSSEGSRSVKENRAWLAAKLRLTTFYDYIKAYIDAAVGQPLVDVPEAVEKREIKLALWEIRSVTLQHMLRKMLSRGDFTGALELTEKHRFENIDFVYKEQWRQLGENVTEESVKNVLAHISDKNWVVCECVNSRALDIEVHRALIDLAKEITFGKQTSQRAFVLHCERIFLLVQCLDENNDKALMFIEFRSQSYLDVAIYFAKISRLDIIRKHLLTDPFLRPHLLTLMWFVPEVIEPAKYEFLIPHNVNGWFTSEFEENNPLSLELKSLSNSLSDVVTKLNYESTVYKTNEDLLKFIDNENIQLSDVIQFLKNRCFLIDSTTGLIDILVDLVQLAVSHGFSEMKGFLIDVTFYHDFVLFCGLVSFSLEQFYSATSEVIFKAVEKHMTEKDVCANLDRILQLLEYLSTSGRCDSLRDQLRSFLCGYSKNSLQVLDRIRKIRPDWIDEEILISCFSVYEATGKQLIQDVRRVELPSKYVEALKAFAKHNLEPKFEQLHHSFFDVALARQLLYRLIRSAACITFVQWKKLKDDLLEVFLSFYPDLFTEKEILTMFADELFDLNDIRKTRDLISLVMSFDRPSTGSEEKYRLSREASLDLIIGKSDSFFNTAMPERKDQNLRLAREVLSLIPAECGPTKTKLTKQLSLLDAFDVALGLNCTILPIKFKNSEPENFFADVVRIDDNYKKLEECKKLAELLNINAPFARTLELCAVEALLKRDVKSLREYCGSLLRLPKNESLPQGIHSLCVDIFKSGLLTDMDDELLTYAILTSPPEDILDILYLLHGRETTETFLTSSYVKPASDVVPDPVYTLVDEYLPSDKVGPILINNPTVHVDSLSVTDQAAFESAIANLARHYTHVSSTMALGLSLLLPEDTEWTENIVLAKYSRAIRLALKDLSFKQVQLLPPCFLIENYVASISGETSLERILNSGCDRERFFEDFQYRNETLNGIAMTADPLVIKDCIEVAEKYGLESWNICMSALEYTLTDPDVPTENLRSVVSNLGVLERLQSEKDRFYTHLRTRILKAITAAPGCDLRIKLYLDLFDKTQPEYKWLKALTYISTCIEGYELSFFLSDEPSKIANVVLPYLDRNCEKLVENLLLLPNGILMCDNAAHIIFSNERNLVNHVRKCFILLEKDTERFIDLIGSLHVAEEISYLEFVLNNWEFDESLSSLKLSLTERLKILQNVSVAPVFPESFGTSPSTTNLRRRHH